MLGLLIQQSDCSMGAAIKKATEKILTKPQRMFDKVDGVMDLAADKLTNFSTKNPRMGKVLEAYLLACAFNPANLLLIPLTLLLPFILALDKISPWLRDSLTEKIAQSENKLADQEYWAHRSSAYYKEEKMKELAVQREELNQLKDVLKNREQDKLNQLSEISWR